MQKYLRITVLTGALMLMACPVFASGPGDGDPPPPPVSSATTSRTVTSATAAAISVLLSYLGL